MFIAAADFWPRQYIHKLKPWSQRSDPCQLYVHTIRKDSSQRENPAFIEWSTLSTLSSVDKMQNSVFSQNQSDLVICRKFGVCLHLHISFVIKTRANYVILVSFTLHEGKNKLSSFSQWFRRLWIWKSTGNLVENIWK